MPATVKSVAAIAWLVLLAVPAAAQQPPRVTNGSVTARPAVSPLAPFFQQIVASQPEIAWIGYAVPAAEGRSVDCGNASAPASGRSTGPVHLEGTERLLVLFRVADRRVDRVRVLSEECELDAGGRPVQWLENVNPVDSVRLLETLASPDEVTTSRDRAANGALVAIALHGGTAREAATDTLVRLARTAKATRTRGDALFWLAHMAGTKAAGVIAERLDKDPDTEVKKTAVFALSQLPKDEGVPLLINVARTNSNPAVRKQAMFWLGQSRDSRAIDFFAEILK